MALKRQKICLLFCGGSTLIGHDNKSIEVETKRDIAQWLAEVPELKVIADIEPVFILGETEEKISPKIWTVLTKEIKKRYSNNDGFVITHDFDSIAYSGAALSFMLQNLGKPVIFTGSQEKSDIVNHNQVFENFRSLGIRANLINAIQMATMDIAEVGIMYGNRLLRATQTQKLPASQINLYDTQIEYLGKVDFGIRLSEDRQRRRKTALILRPEIEPGVFVLHLHPGMQLSACLDLLDKELKGVIIRASDITLKPDDYRQLEQVGKNRSLPIFIQPGNEAEIKKRTHLIVLPPMIPEISLVKVMWALGQTSSLVKLREIMKENFANEFLIRI